MFAALLIALGERLAGEYGFVLFDKCSHAFNLIAVCEAQTEYVRLIYVCRPEVHFEALVDGRLCKTHGVGAAGGYLVCKLFASSMSDS